MAQTRHVDSGEVELPPIIVTLVHGTFDPGAAWTMLGSLLHSAVTAWTPPGTVIQQFQWTDANAVGDRVAASNDLRQLLLSRPDAEHVVIGHSHGGNVAVHAVSPVLDDINIAGVCCLATPFEAFRLWTEEEMSGRVIENALKSLAPGSVRSQIIGLSVRPSTKESHRKHLV